MKGLKERGRAGGGGIEGESEGRGAEGLKERGRVWGRRDIQYEAFQ